ncbi:MAG: 23S rRNA (uracil(1939)-C(5))-methyltransferase RlmD [Defluviitaleaceae bacterium]|nr:23S rRNA (uracil(1939)-C(5))-methyltransferase RlmD [Defluviitaleaceae bacterium]
MCEIFGICGGCQHQDISYEEELKLKEKEILELLSTYNFKYEGIDTAGPLEYRNKMEYSFGDESKDGDLALGLRKKRSFYEVVNSKTCNIVDNDFLDILYYTQNFFKERNVPFYHKKRHVGILRHLIIRKGHFTNELLVNIVTTSTTIEEEYAKGLKNLKPNVVSVLHTINNAISDVVKAEELRILYGRDYFTEKLLGLDFKISPFAFFQTNSRGAEVLYQNVINFAKNFKAETIYDLYCGTGTIGMLLSKNAKKVIGIDIVEESIMSAKYNQQLNGINNCEFIAGDVKEVITTLKENPDLVILDPPREGLHKKALAYVTELLPKSIIYVSCKATSLNRDLEVLNTLYNIDKLKIVDMFPRTKHVETIAVLTIKN